MCPVFIENHRKIYISIDIFTNQVMWQTFLVILDYLENINKIAFDKEGKIAYIWNPRLAKMLRQRKEIII